MGQRSQKTHRLNRRALKVLDACPPLSLAPFIFLTAATAFAARSGLSGTIGIMQSIAAPIRRAFFPSLQPNNARYQYKGTCVCVCQKHWPRESLTTMVSWRWYYYYWWLDIKTGDKSAVLLVGKKTQLDPFTTSVTLFFYFICFLCCWLPQPSWQLSW